MSVESSSTADGQATLAFAESAQRGYRLTLEGMTTPWPVLAAFNALAVGAMALIGAPLLAAAWLAVSVGYDVVQWLCFKRWRATVDTTPDTVGLRRLTIAATLRSTLWIVGPTILCLTAPTPAAYAFLAVTVGSLACTAASAGWTSRGVWIGMAAPPLVAALAIAAPTLSLRTGAGLALSLSAFLLTAALIRLATRRLIGQAVEASARTQSVMDALNFALARSAAAESATARSEERLRLAMKMADMHVWELDYERRELSKAGAEDTFFTEPKTFEELSGDIYTTVDPRDVDAVKAAWREHYRNGTPFHPEYRIRRSDDREVWAAASMELITDAEGKPLRAIGALHNITERKQAEQQLLAAKEEAEAANRTKSQFLANMSHEIRTPMNGVIGMNELLLRTRLSPEQRKFAEAVRTSADALLDLINDILDISKLEAGKVELEAIDFSLGGVVEDVVELLAPKATEKGLEIACYVDSGARAPFVGDPTRLRQVLLNLASNAIKFTERGHVVLGVRGVERANGLTGLRFEVQDTGIGLTDEQKGKLFRNFQQADGSTTRKYGGTGLGLSICRQLVELMGGRIGVADGATGGSVFWFEIELPPGEAPQSVAVTPRSLNGLRILVVDDLSINRAIFRDQLEHEGATVVEAASGAACLRRLEAAQRANTPFDLVLMDHQMPGMAGDETAAKIRAGTAWTQPRIVIASSMGAPPEGPQIYDAFLNKPVRHAALLASLGAVMGGTIPPVPLAEAGGELPEVGASAGLVLVAEDNEINILLATEILRQVGLAFRCVKNGRDALAAAEEGGFDLILMDVHMPEMDGLEATRRIRRLPEPLCSVPIVAMTANAMKSDREACLAAGMDDFVSKPFKPEEFVATLQRIFAEPEAEMREAS